MRLQGILRARRLCRGEACAPEGGGGRTNARGACAADRPAEVAQIGTPHLVADRLLRKGPANGAIALEVGESFPGTGQNLNARHHRRPGGPCTRRKQQGDDQRDGRLPGPRGEAPPEGMPQPLSRETVDSTRAGAGPILWPTRRNGDAVRAAASRIGWGIQRLVDGAHKRARPQRMRGLPPRGPPGPVMTRQRRIIVSRSAQPA